MVFKGERLVMFVMEAVASDGGRQRKAHFFSFFLC